MSNTEEKTSEDYLKKKDKMKNKDKEYASIKDALLDYGKTFLIIFVVVFALSQFVYINATIPSGSMQNTIMQGDRIFGNRLAYIKDDPDRYDIIIFKYPDDTSKTFIKRVIGLPGETVEIKNGNVYINGSDEPLDDSFCAEETQGEFGPYVVPEDSYFVMGDNRNNSLDSRYWKNTFVSKDQILAKAVFRYWPFNSISFVD